MKQATLFLTALTILIFCSCSSKSDREFYAPSADYELAELKEEAIPEKVETAERKLIKEGDISFKTTDLNETKTLIMKSVQELNGYITKENVYTYSDKLEHRLTIRVPVNNFDLLLKSISESVEKFDSKSIDVFDVSEEYIDIEARIKTKKDLLNRYTELLKQASKIDEILTIEKEIGKLQSEIESFEGRMKYLNDRVAFSTLNVRYYQKTTQAFGFASKFVEGIKNGWDVFLWVVIGLSHIWVFIIVSVAIIYFVKKWRKKKRHGNN